MLHVFSVILEYRMDGRKSSARPTVRQGFPWTVYTWEGDLSPSHMGGQVQEEKALMGGLMRGDIDLMGGGGGLTLIDYIIN